MYFPPLGENKTPSHEESTYAGAWSGEEWAESDRAAYYRSSAHRAYEMEREHPLDGNDHKQHRTDINRPEKSRDPLIGFLTFVQAQKRTLYITYPEISRINLDRAPRPARQMGATVAGIIRYY